VAEAIRNPIRHATVRCNALNPLQGIATRIPLVAKGLLACTKVELHAGCNALNPLQGIATLHDIRQGRTSCGTRRCNALNPLQGIATQARMPSIRRWSGGTSGCNALNPLQGIATRPTKLTHRQPRLPFSVATHSIPFRGLQPQSTSVVARTLPRLAVATHSIPFRGLQLSPRATDRSHHPSAALQRTQSPSGDCNVLITSQSQSGSLRCQARPSSCCNALNPLQGIATPQVAAQEPLSSAPDRTLQRTQSPSGDCNRREGSNLELQRTQSPSGD
jgi:hypothetical protein